MQTLAWRLRSCARTCTFQAKRGVEVSLEVPRRAALSLPSPATAHAGVRSRFLESAFD